MPSTAAWQRRSHPIASRRPSPPTGEEASIPAVLGVCPDVRRRSRGERLFSGALVLESAARAAGMEARVALPPSSQPARWDGGPNRWGNGGLRDPDGYTDHGGSVPGVAFAFGRHT